MYPLPIGCTEGAAEEKLDDGLIGRLGSTRDAA